jgi:membrane-associated phospholipid phosphatase
MEPVHREILEQDMPLYSHKPSSNTVTTPELITISIGVPLVTMMMWAISRKDVSDLTSGLLSLSLSFALNGVVTNVLKIAVGRPRPDFIWRCFPGGVVSEDLTCNGSLQDIREGRKSFPSGHASWMFTGFVFTSLYFAGKLFVFSSKRGHSLNLVATLVPILGATLVGVSRIRDRRHHWDDVVVGAVIGSVMACLAYFQYYPSLTDVDSDVPHNPLESPTLPRRNTLQRRTFSMSTLSENMDGTAVFDGVSRTKLN